MPATVIVGAQWGDEGKGKITDLLAEDAAVVIRYQGGSNAGHTVVVNGEEFKLHLIPSGILREETLCIMASGTIIDPISLREEIEALRERGVSCSNLRISVNAHVIMPYHRLLDGLQEDSRGKKSIGTTRRGIGPTYTDKTARMPRSIRMGDLLDDDRLRELIEAQLDQKNVIIREVYGHEPLDPDEVHGQVSEVLDVVRPHIADVRRDIREAVDSGRTIILEGAQGTFLDLDYGTYPYVTSSHPVAGGACLGTSIGPTEIDEVVAVVKAYTTRVGAGAFPTELEDETGDQLRERGAEFGTTTGRPRRCGWLDGVALRTAAELNGATSIAITKLDVLDELETIRVAVAYEIDGEPHERMPENLDMLAEVTPIYEELAGWQQPLDDVRSHDALPAQARAYTDRMAELAGCPVWAISVGPSRNQTIIC
ncbi:MAG: adenylosuccinate synthase [Armatimonadota bacterium]|nr:adenylosuccinate synthase [Armatimonadota bacterium]